VSLVLAYRGHVARLSPGARRWTIDAGLTGVVLLVAEIAILAGHEAGSISRNWFAYALGVAMAVPVLLRRYHALLVPYLVAIVLLVFYSIGYPGFPPAAVLAVPLYDAARAGRPWQALPVPVVLLSAGMIVASRKGPLLDVVDVFLPQFSLVAVALLLGALLRSREAYAVQAQERLRAIATERERDAERRVAEERLRIARELHDTVAHAISTITVQSGTALYMIDEQPDQARQALAAIRQTGKAALAEMRATLHVLRADGEPAVAAQRDAGLDRLPALLAAVRAAGLNVAMHSDLEEAETTGRPRKPLPDSIDHAAYRILQESLTNVLRHAGPRARAEIRIRRDATTLDVEVRDDGQGVVTPPRGDGHGLAGMAERAKAIGGFIETGGLDEGGFRVWARLPLDPDDGGGVG
jgi:signal transduction histidine kinase